MKGTVSGNLSLYHHLLWLVRAIHGFFIAIAMKNEIQLLTTVEFCVFMLCFTTISLNRYGNNKLVVSTTVNHPLFSCSNIKVVDLPLGLSKPDFYNTIGSECWRVQGVLIEKARTPNLKELNGDNFYTYTYDILLLSKQERLYDRYLNRSVANVSSTMMFD